MRAQALQSGACGGQRILSSGTGVKVVVGGLVEVLGTMLGSSARTVQTFMCRAESSQREYSPHTRKYSPTPGVSGGSQTTGAFSNPECHQTLGSPRTFGVYEGGWKIRSLGPYWIVGCETRRIRNCAPCVSGLGFSS